MDISETDFSLPFANVPPLSRPVSNACLVAKHRGAKNVEVKDVQLILEKNYNLYIPGFGSLPLNEEFKNAYKKSPATEAHKQRMALIKKTLKKF